MLSTLLCLALTQSQSAMFPFVIPWDGSLKGTPLDVSFLNDGPAGSHGRIIAKNGVFIEEKTGKRVRFLGTNLAAGGAFPSHEDADKIADHLAQVGINIVRLHHLQNTWDQDGGMIWKKDKLYLELDPVQLDKLDYFVAALKKRGIYANVNLQTTRTYIPEMGFPESVLKIPTGFCKRIDKIDRHMIELQKEYARQLIDRTNPYTGLKYTQDPAIAVIEINNENSLVGDPWATMGVDLDQMPEPFKGEIVQKWNEWLAARYHTDDAVKAAWTRGVTPIGPPLPLPAWSKEHQGTADVDFGSEGQVTVRKNPGPEWHVQFVLPGLDLHEGDTYTVSFRAKSSQANVAHLGANLDQDDWHGLGLWTEVALGTDWRTYRFAFTAQNTRPNHGRLGFGLGATIGTTEIKDVVIHPGLDNAVPAGASLANKSYPIVANSATAPQRADFIHFLADAETAYSTEMRSFLRKDLQAKANLIDTQISWGGLTGIMREADSDFADNHAYWQHPTFPHKAWDSEDWYIPNTPMVDRMGSDGGELGNLVKYRVFGKPYTISEYNHPAPNDYRAEMMPLVATFGSRQDWDIIYSFDYGITGPNRDNDKIQGYFACGSDPAKKALFPAAALIFRQGRIRPTSVKQTLVVSKTQPWVPSVTAFDAWNKTQAPDLFGATIGIDTKKGTTPATATPGDRPKVITGASGPIYVAAGGASAAVVGHVGGETVQVPGLGSLAFGKFGNGFASATLVYRSGLTSSAVLTLVGKVENQGMEWNATRTSVGTHWGHGPVLAEGIPCKVSLHQRVKHVWALGSSGKKTLEVPVQQLGDGSSFEVGPAYKTLWYSIEP